MKPTRAAGSGRSVGWRVGGVAVTLAVLLGLVSLTPPARAAVDRAGGCVDPDTRFDCATSRRFAAVEAYLATRPGVTGVAFSDRGYNAVWHSRFAERPVYMASTVKLAIALDLLIRHNRHESRLRPRDWGLIHRALVHSDNAATTELWRRHGGERMAPRFRRYGMTQTTFAPGTHRSWGTMRSTAADLRRLIRYTLRVAPVNVRRYLMDRMRRVTATQRWGVWDVGPTYRPGVKNGWYPYRTGWVTNSVGFAGRSGRYLIAVVSDQGPGGSYQAGETTTSTVARMLLPPR